MKLKTQEAGASLTDPVLEIKKFKHYAGMSEETEAFTGELYVDGKFLAHVKNDGHGGCNHMQAVGEAREALSKLLLQCSRMPRVTSAYTTDGLEFNLDFAISHMVGLMVYRKKLKTRLRNKLGYRLRGEHYAEGEFHIVKLPDTLLNRERVETKAPVEKWMNDEANTPVRLHVSEIHAALCADSHGRS